MAKDPKDRFARCADFARALRHHLDDGDGAVDATRPAPVATPAATRSWLRTGIVLPAVLAVLLVVAIVFAVTEFRRADDESTTARAQSTSSVSPTTSRPPSPPSIAPPPPAAPPPVTDTETVTETTTAAPASVVIGANCTPVGSTATTADGSTAYCSTLQTTGASIWSLTQGDIPSPTVTADPTEPALPVAEESPVRVCMQQTGMTRRECRESIRRGNGLP